MFDYSFCSLSKVSIVLVTSENDFLNKYKMKCKNVFGEAFPKCSWTVAVLNFPLQMFMPRRQVHKHSAQECSP